MQVLPSPIPQSFKITNQYVWLPTLYTLPAHISYDVTCGSETDEFLPCFSFTKAEWASPECDALCWYASPHRDDFTFRTKLFGETPTLKRLSPPYRPTVGTKFQMECKITATSATYSINGKDYATATYKEGKVPEQGYFGFAKYRTANIIVENVNVGGNEFASYQENQITQYIEAHKNDESPDADAASIWAIAVERNLYPTQSKGLLNAAIEDLIESYCNGESSKPDFSLSQLVRVYYLTDEEDIKDKIKAAVLSDARPQPWITKGEEHVIYWSENHLIMSLSNIYLLHKAGIWGDEDVPEGIDQAIKALAYWFELKAKYGFFEFNSSVYFPYTLGGILNVLDFGDLRNDMSADAYDNALSSLSSLLQGVMAQTTIYGNFYPAAGRNYNNKYTGSDGNYMTLINNLLMPSTAKSRYQDWTDASQASAMMATSSNIAIKLIADDAMRVINATNTGKQIALNDTKDLGVSMEFIHSPMEPSPSTNSNALDNSYLGSFFDWSRGGYYYDKFFVSTLDAVDHYDLTNHESFKPIFSALDMTYAEMLGYSGLSNILNPVTSGTDIGQLHPYIWKKDGVALSSFNSFYPGAYGYQARPWAATVNDKAVFTQSGTIPQSSSADSWKSDDYHDNANTHLPRVTQSNNLAAIAYWPLPQLSSLPCSKVTKWKSGKEYVSLHMPIDNFLVMKTKSGDYWGIAEDDGNYIAVLIPGGSDTPSDYTYNGVIACQGSEGRMLWAVFVSDSEEFGDFTGFANMVYNTASHYENKYFSFPGYTYHTIVHINGQTIENKWTRTDPTSTVLEDIPDIPGLPGIPDIPGLPDIPDIPGLPF